MTMMSTPPERTSMSAISSPARRVRLRDEQLADVDAELAGVDGIERVLGIDVGGDAARLLHLRDDLQHSVVLPDDSGPVDLDDAAARQAPTPERDIEPERAGGDDLEVVLDLASPIFMIEPLPNCFLDLGQGGGERLVFWSSTVLSKGMGGSEVWRSAARVVRRIIT
jgi:hypothetical protein